MEKVGLYIHIPFCQRKCHYCDFTSVAGNKELMDRYVEFLVREISIASATYKGLDIGSVFIGGGTPSLLHEDKIAEVMDALGRSFTIDPHAEITIEINPGTLTIDKAISYRKAGINRASIGIQSMNNKILRIIGRIHKEEQVINTVGNLRMAGFQNISGDLMFGLPHQKLNDWMETLEKIMELKLEHISMYGLILEEETLLYGWHKRGLVSMPSENEERQMYHTAIDFLESRGYGQYEISNFAKEGYESAHNLGYWKLKPYIGIGLSSHSSMDGRRYWNYSSFGDYFRKVDQGELPIEGDEKISRTLQESEYLILGIRLNEGISIDAYEKKFNSNFWEKYGEAISRHKNSGLVQVDDGSIRLTRKGMDLSNQVEMDFLP